jgi:hypothetical protein
MAKKQDHKPRAIADEVAAEVKRVLPKATIESAPAGVIPGSDSARLHDLAVHIIQGSIALEEVNNLSPQGRGMLAEMVAEMIALRNDPETKRNQRANPYYNPSGSKIIKDGK